MSSNPTQQADTITMTVTTWTRQPTRKQQLECDSECFICGRPTKENRGWLAANVDYTILDSETGTATATFRPLAGLIGSEPGEWAVVLGPSCGKQLPATHRTRSEPAWAAAYPTTEEA